jgi:hypothetical protein
VVFQGDERVPQMHGGFMVSYPASVLRSVKRFKFHGARVGSGEPAVIFIIKQRGGELGFEHNHIQAGHFVVNMVGHIKQERGNAYAAGYNSDKQHGQRHVDYIRQDFILHVKYAFNNTFGFGRLFSFFSHDIIAVHRIRTFQSLNPSTLQNFFYMI